MSRRAAISLTLVRPGVLALGLFLFGLQPGLGQGDVEEVTKLQNEVIQLHQQGRDQDAIPIAERVRSIIEKARGEEHPDVVPALGFLALLYESTGDYARAEPLCQRSLAIQEKTLGPEHPDVATALNQLAHLYDSRGDYARAEPLYQRSLAIREKTLGKEHPDVATTLNNLAKLYDSRGDYTRAEPLYRQSLAIREKALGPEHPDVGAVLSNLAALYYSLGDYARAEPLYQRSLAIDEKALGGEHPDVATTLTNLALLDQKQGNYARAELLNQRALAIDEKALGKEHRAVAAVLNSLAALYDSRGEYALAEPLLQRALAIDEKALGKEHPDVAPVLNNLAGLYQSLGDCAGAEPLYQRSLAIREKALGKDHPDVAASLNNLAMLYESIGDYPRAEPLYQRALAIDEKAFGKEHPDTDAVIGNIAGLLLHQGKLEAAYPLLKQGGWPTGLGLYYLLKHDYSEAHKRLLRAIQGAEKTGESRHLLASYIGVGLALEGLGRHAEAANSYRVAVDLIEEQRAALGPAERTHFLSGQVGAGFKRILAYEGLVRTSAKLGDASEALRWSEHTKARQLLEATVRSRIAPGVPTELAEKEERLTTHLGALYRQREATLSKNPELFKSIEREQLPKAKKELNDFVIRLRQQYPAYAAYKYPQPLGVTQIALRPSEALLEYAVTEDETFAWLLRDRKVVKFTTIPVGRKALAQQIRDYRSLFQGIRRTADLRSDVEQGRQLYDLLVKELVSACAPGDTLIIVPDGSLGLLPFEALVVEAGGSPETKTEVRYLGDAFPIQYAQSATVLSNARTLATKGAEHQGQKLLVVADPVFDEADSRWRSAPAVRVAQAEEKTDDYRIQQMRAVAEDTTGTPTLPRLGKTADLLRGLQESFGVERVQGLSGLLASESSLRKQRLADYRYLVFATHGVLGGQLRYLQEPALVLSQVGVDSTDPDNDGYLTLSEVMGLQLNAEVAALTACETGVGQELDGEGVMGMGWAFEYAGARNVVMSLWSVDQESTVKLTESFFTHLRKGLPPQEALRQARAELRTTGYGHPFYWAPFILVGEG